MIKSTNFLLCSTHHDPEFKLKNLLKKVASIIKKLFIKTIVCLTPTTSEKVYKFLSREGFMVIIGSSMRQIDIYRKALKTTLNNIEKQQTEKIFYIDFDRLIHWIHAYPNELTNLINKKIDVDYLHIGRTSRAFDTHPSTQQKTEIIINEIVSKTLGFLETKDIISVCGIFTKELGEKIMRVKNETATGFYCTWPLFFWNWATKKQYIEVEGLEWETPDKFKVEITELGYKEWVKQFQSPLEWEKRVRFLHEGLLELSQVSDFKFCEKSNNSK
ncbi:MAG: hypothetical protein ACFE8A_08985 [Candidatus Hodarchaeota archaeon]